MYHRIHQTPEERIEHQATRTADNLEVAIEATRENNPKDAVRKLEEIKSASLITNQELKKINKRESEKDEATYWIRGKKGEKGNKGEKGDRGERGPVGPEGKSIVGMAGSDGVPGIDGRDGKDGVDGKDGRDGKNGKDGIDGKDGSPDTSEEIIEKINTAKKKILISQIKGLSAILDELDKVGKFPLGQQMSTRTGSIHKRAKMTPTLSGANITLDLNVLPYGYVEILGVFRQGQLLEAEATSGWTKSGTTITVYNATTDESFYVDYNY